jgi:hypothetical protein
MGARRRTGGQPNGVAHLADLSENVREHQAGIATGRRPVLPGDGDAAYGFNI